MKQYFAEPLQVFFSFSAIRFFLSVSLTGICYNHRLQTNPGHYEEETKNTDNLNTIKVKQPTVSYAKLERELGTKLQNKIPTQKHNKWEQQQLHFLSSTQQDSVSYMF